MQQFWFTVTKIQKTNFYEFKLANKKCQFDVEVFRKALDICPRVQGKEFILPPSEKELLTFLIGLGYKGELTHLPQMFIDHMHQPWRTLASIINKCLSGKTTSNDRLRQSRVAIIWGMFHKKYVDFAELIWEDFSYQIDNRQLKKSIRKIMPYPRFTKFVRIGEDIQEYGRTIPEAMLTDAIKQSKTYKAFIGYSTGLVPPKKTRGKGSQGKNRRKSKNKVSISADDNFITKPDVALELRKSISLTEAEEEEAARRVHTTHERLVTESDEPSGTNRPTGRRRTTVADTMQALKASKKISRIQPHTGGSSKGTCVSPGVPDESTVILTTSSEGTGTKLRVPDEVKGIAEAKADSTLNWGLDEESEYSEEENVDEEIARVSTDDEEENDDDDDDDDRSIDIVETDDEEETDDEFVHDDEYVHDDVDKEIKDVEVTKTGKDDEEINDAEKTDAEKTKEVKDDNKKAELPPTSFSLSVSSGFGNQFLNLSFDKSPVRIIKDSTDAEINSLLDIQIQQEVSLIQSLTLLNVHVFVIPEQTVPIVSPATTHSPPPPVTNLTHVLQQQTTPIPTPPITTIAPNVTTVPDPLPAIVQRVSVPPAVKEYLGDALQKVLRKHTKELIHQSSHKDVPEIHKTKQEFAAKEKMPKVFATPYDPIVEAEFKQNEILFNMMQESKDHGDDKDKDHSVGPNQGKKTKRRRTKESESSKKSSTSNGNSSPKTSKSDKPVHAEESGDVPTEEVIMDASHDNVVIDVDQPQDDSEPKKDKALKNDWFKQPPRPPTPNPEWNKGKVVDASQEHTWFNDLLSAKKGPLTFGKLMATHIDFSKFAMNRLKIDKLTKAHLVGLVYNLLKGTCQSSIELEYNMEECYKASSDQLDWNNPEGDRCPFDLSKPLPLKGRPGHLTTKAARYELVGIEDMIPSLWSVTKVGYDEDAERGIKHWGPKRQLFYSDIVDLVVALRMFTRSLIIKRRVDDVQLGVESYQKNLNITKPQKDFPRISAKELYTPSFDPARVVYKDLIKRKRVMRADELYKFSDGTLKLVRDELHHIILNFCLGYNKEMSRRKWSATDKIRS
ncbi:hypothetical protein Tco_0915384 [Tanacetum coccineum]